MALDCGMKKLNEIADNAGNILKVLGMHGLMFSNGIEKYYVDSELLVGSENGIAIFKGSIKYFDEEDKRQLTKAKKEEILNIVLDLFSSENIKVLLEE